MPSPSSLYSGPAARARLVEDLRRQELLTFGASAEAVASVAQILTYDAGEQLMVQDDREDDALFFILQGRVRICASNREIRVRSARCHVGELGCIDPRAGRSADVIAIERCEVARITADQFRDLAANPDLGLWRRLSETLADRLREYTNDVRRRNDRPQIFIGSTGESLPIARALERGLNANPGLNARAWTSPDIFRATHATMEDLESMVKSVDYMVLVATADDFTISRGRRTLSMRDNIILEIGLGIGAISRERTFIVTRRSEANNLRLPSDLLGLTTVRFDDAILGPYMQPRWLPRWVRAVQGAPDALLDSAVKDACETLATRMVEDGPF